MSESYAVQRRHPRVSARIDVRISTLEPERDPWTGRPFFRATHDTCANVSCGGAFVQTSEPLRPGRRVLVELQIPDGPAVETLGRVAWSKVVLAPRHDDGRSRVGIGVEFLSGSKETFAALEEFIERAAGDVSLDLAKLPSKAT